MAAQTAEIKCSTKAEHTNPHERITHVGGSGVHPWKLPLDQAINQIEKGRWTFYIKTPGDGRLPVVIAEYEDGTKYLTTDPDGAQMNDLFGLPDCP